MFFFILFVLSLLSLSKQSEIKVLFDLPIGNKNVFIDTAFSDVPLDITFKNDSDNLTFFRWSIMQISKMGFKDWIINNKLNRENCYEIILPSDSTLRTLDTSKLGFE